MDIQPDPSKISESQFQNQHLIEAKFVDQSRFGSSLAQYKEKKEEGCLSTIWARAKWPFVSTYNLTLSFVCCGQGLKEEALNLEPEGPKRMQKAGKT